MDIPVLTAKDITDLQEFAAKNSMDYVAASFVQTADDVRFIRYAPAVLPVLFVLLSPFPLSLGGMQTVATGRARQGEAAADEMRPRPAF